MADDANGEATGAGDVQDSGGDETPPTLSYAAPPGPANYKTLRRMPSFEANLAASKLEAAGIHCFIADEHVSAAHPLAFSEVRLQVLEEELERADEILKTPSAPASSDEADDDDYVEEAYRCPKCHTKAVDLLPVSPGVSSARLGCAAAVLIPVFLSLFPWLVPPEVLGRRGEWPTPIVLAWLTVVAVLAYIVLRGKRRKRCRECGWEWGGEAADR